MFSIILMVLTSAIKRFKSTRRKKRIQLHDHVDMQMLTYGESDFPVKKLNPVLEFLNARLFGKWHPVPSFLGMTGKGARLKEFQIDFPIESSE